MLTSAQGGANADVTVTILGLPNLRHRIYTVGWSYSAAPTAGKVSSTGLEGNQTDLDITAGGIGQLPYPPVDGRVGTAVSVTLAAGGGTVVGKLVIKYESE